MSSRLLVVPDSDRVEQWLLEEARRADFVDLRSVRTLSQVLADCDPAGWAKRVPADDLLVRMAFGRLAPVYAVTGFGPMAHSAEFALDAQRLIGELRAQAVTAKQLEEAGAASGVESIATRTKALANVWRELDVFLAERRMVDLGDWWRLATERLQRDGLPAPLRGHSEIALQWVHDLPAAKLVFFEALASACMKEGVAFTWRWPSTGVTENDAFLSEPLREIEAKWQLLEAEVVADVVEPPSRAPFAFHAPTPRAEVREIARRVRESINAGVPPEAIAVVWREPGDDAVALAEALAELNVPVRARLSVPLLESPHGRHAVALLELVERSFPADDVATLLESPCVSLLAPEAADPRGAFREAGLRDDALGASASSGAYAVRLASLASRAGESKRSLLLLAESVARLLEACRSIPAQGPAMELLEAWWDAVTRTGLRESPRSVSSHPLPGLMEQQVDFALARDQEAVQSLDVLLTALKEALRTSGLFRTFMTRREFIRWVHVAAADVTLPMRTPRAGAVWLLDVKELVGRRFAQLFIAGLVEGRFPGRKTPQPLLSDDERVALNRAAKRTLFRGSVGEGDARAPLRLAEDRFLFHWALTAAASVTLSHARYDEKGREVIASPFFDELGRSFGDDFVVEAVHRTTVPSLDEVQTEEELRIRVALESMSPDVTRMTPVDPRRSEIPALFGDEAWFARAARRGSIETERLRFFTDQSVATAAHTGRVEGATLSLLQERLRFDSSSPVSAHELAEWGVCAFRGLSTMVMGLEAKESAGEELDSRTRGTFWHEALARVVPLLDERGLLGKDEATIRPHVLEAIGGAATKVARGNPTGHPALWTLAQEWAVTVLCRVVSQNGTPFGLARPKYFEVRFGVDKAPAALREVKIPATRDGEVDVYLYGQMDRIDVGEGVVGVLDYKTSVSRTLAQDFLRREFQMAFYVFAAQSLLPGVVPSAGWLGLNRNELRPLFSVMKGNSVADLLATNSSERVRLEREGKPNLPNAVFSLLGRLRDGDFGPRPMDCEFCALKPVCRISQRQLQEDGR